jgi:hypothetical protein
MCRQPILAPPHFFLELNGMTSRIAQHTREALSQGQVEDSEVMVPITSTACRTTRLITTGRGWLQMQVSPKFLTC